MRRELTNSFETLTGLADHFCVLTLFDLMYLQSAILVNWFIDHYDDSQIQDMVNTLSPAKQWREFIREIT